MRMVKTPHWPADLKALIDRILDETGLNKAQLAALVGINPSQVSRWTNGSSRPRFDTIAALGQVIRTRFPELGVGPAELTTAAGYSTKQSPAASEPVADQVDDDGLPVSLDDFPNPSPGEVAMLQAIAAMKEEIRQLREKVEGLQGDQEEQTIHGNKSA